MTSALRRHFDSHVIRHFRWEMFLMRLLFSFLLFYTIPAHVWHTSQAHPNGLAHFLDLTFLSDPDWLLVVRISLVAALALYTVNILALPSLGVMLFVSVAYGSLNNSQGAMNHSMQPVSLVVLAQFLVAAYYGCRRGVAALWQGLPEDQQRLMIYAAKVAIVSCYVVSAVTKLQRSNGTWLWHTPNVAAQILKTADDRYYNQLQPRPEHIEPVAYWMAQHPHWTRLLMAPALLLEFFAFLALINRAWAFFIGIALFVMHSLISSVMQLGFFELKSLLVIFLVNVPFLLWIGPQWILGRRKVDLL